MLTTQQLQHFAQNAQARATSPEMLVDLSIIKNRATMFRELFPAVDLYYAIKCFPDARVVEVLDPLIDGYDVASIHEINSLVEQGVDASRLTFSNPVKAESAVAQAHDQGLARFAVQSIDELQKVAANAPGSAVYVRITVPSAVGSLDFSSKFGIDPDEALPILGEAIKLGLKPLGVTFHVGSQAQDISAWSRAIEVGHKLMRSAKEIGISLPELNIGGGFPVIYHEEEVSIVAVAEAVNQALAAISEEFPGTRFIAEPGRFLTADCAVIATTVIGKEDRAGIPWLYLDTGTFQSFVELFEFGEFIYPVFSQKHVLSGKTDTDTTIYALTGPTCDSYDTMTRAIKLPVGIEVGDTVLITMTGAYTLAYGSNFNGFSLPEVVFIDELSEDPATVSKIAETAQAEVV